MSTSQTQLDAPTGAEDQAALLIAIARELVEQTRPDTRGRLHVTLASSIDRDLGLDSLARVELGLRVERALDARLPEGAAATAENLGDLLGALRSAGNGANAKTGVAPTARSEEPDAVVGEPDDARTLIEMLDWHVTRRPDRLEVTFLATDMERQTLTHGDLAARARRVAATVRRKPALCVQSSHYRAVVFAYQTGRAGIRTGTICNHPGLFRFACSS